MKKTIYTMLCLLISGSIFPQECPVPQNGANLKINNIKAHIKLGGDFFSFNGDAAFMPDWQNGPSSPTTISGAGLWVCGVNAEGTIKMTASTYSSPSRGEYIAGPLNPETGIPYPNGCFDWDQVFMVLKSDIIQFRATSNRLTTAQKIQNFRSIMGWPGRGNPFFQSINSFSLPTNTSLAPFFDADGDAVYNPEKGDYPVVELQGFSPFIPDQLIWGVMNDLDRSNSHVEGSRPLGIEVQFTAWAFNCTQQPVMNNTVFTSHKLIYRGQERLEPCFVGIWTDFDIGCYLDDYIGCAPELDSYYAYNSDQVDGPCVFDAEFEHPPVQSVTFLNHKMERFAGYVSPFLGIPPLAITTPVYVPEYYNYLSGRWRDGTPLTEGGNGYNTASATPTSFLFPNHPSDPNGWTACTAAAMATDWYGLGVIRPGQEPGVLQPGEVVEVTTAWTVHHDPVLPCGLSSTYEDIATIKEVYLNGFSNCGSLPTAAYELNTALNAFPNPTSDFCTIEYGNSTARELRVVAADGRLVAVFNQLPNGKFVVPMGQLAPGSYVLSLLTDEGVVTGKAVKI